MIRKRVTRILILAAVFIAAVVIISYVTNKGNTDMTADMGEASLPRIAFTSGDYEINELAGYVKDMDITAVRDTITPVGVDGTLTAKIHKYDQNIKSITFKVYSLDGKNELMSGESKESKSSLKLNIGEALGDVDEAVLIITVKTDKEKSINYYTRVTKPDEINTAECLDFAKKFHEDALGKKDTEFISGLIETDNQADTAILQHVTLNSDIKQIQWGSLSPTVSGDMSISIKEARPTYSSILMKYQVKCKGDGKEEDIYNVREFFRVRSSKGKMYLLSYDRTMNEVFSEDKTALDEKGITLGVTEPDIAYRSSSSGTIVSFVQERELWNYNKDGDELSLVFSFAASEGKDSRNLNDQHEIKLIDVDKSGNTVFAVYGYMNRGEHEGEVGAAIYYYSQEKNSIEEKAFIPSRKSYEIAADELGRLIYYSKDENAVYVMSSGTLYKADLAKGGSEILVKDLKEGQYIASSDGHLLAYQQDGDIYEASTINILNLKNGKQSQIIAGDGDSIRPLGFVLNDFVYGTSKKADAGRTVSGEAVAPMYKVEINDSKNQTAKTYQVDAVYILSAEVNENMITLRRAAKNGDTYTGMPDEYITNNQEKKEGNISLQEFSTDLKGVQYRLKYEDGIKDKEPKILKPKFVLFEKPTVLEFENTEDNGKVFVYGRGKMLGVYEKVADAVKAADPAGGVVVSSKQKYIWERGNRDLSYQAENLESFSAAEGESTLAACLNAVAGLEGKEKNAAASLEKGNSPAEALAGITGGQILDLTGCTVEELLYIIGKGTPVIAMTDQNNAVLLTGYNSSAITYIDPSTGKRSSVSEEEISNMTSGSGNTFISYMK